MKKKKSESKPRQVNPVLTFRLSPDIITMLDYLAESKYRIKNRTHAIRLLIEDGWKEYKIEEKKRLKEGVVIDVIGTRVS